MAQAEQQKQMPGSHDAPEFAISQDGALLCLPAEERTPRRVLMTRSPLRLASAPQPEGYSFYVPDFFLTDLQPWLLPEAPASGSTVWELPAADLLPLLADTDEKNRSADSLAWTPPAFDDFKTSFNDLQAAFQRSDLDKVVPVFFEQAPLADAPIVTPRRLAALLQTPDTLMPYGRWTARGGILGASPEVLFQVQDGTLRTMALAGTLAAPPPDEEYDAERRFLADPKERREHDLVVEGIAEALAPFGAVHVGATVVLRLPTLWHLQTPIEVNLHSAMPSFDALVHALHPTPALGGSPRKEAVEWLRRQDRQENAPLGRQGFGAPFGVQCPGGRMFCLVAVRNVLWNSDTARIGAGGGILRESQLLNEWAELRHKRNSVKRLLGL